MANIISFKQIGQNLLLTIDGETKTKKVEDKEERNSIIALVKDLIDKPNKVKEAKVVKIFTANTVKKEKEVENKKVATKAIEKQVKKEEKGKKGVIASVVDSVKEIVKGKSETELEKLQRENRELKDQLAKTTPKAEPAKTQRRGEW